MKVVSYAKLHLLLVLLKAYRSHLCCEGDRYEKHTSAVIRDVRFALEHGGFYRIDRLSLDGEVAR